MKIQMFLGRIVLKAMVLWIILCIFLFVLRELRLIDPPFWPSTMEATLFILTLVGAGYSVIKLNEWIIEAGDEEVESS